jgi:hypothetical protein
MLNILPDRQQVLRAEKENLQHAKQQCISEALYHVAPRLPPLCPPLSDRAVYFIVCDAVPNQKRHHAQLRLDVPIPRLIVEEENIREGDARLLLQLCEVGRLGTYPSKLSLDVNFHFLPRRGVKLPGYICM